VKGPLLAWLHDRLDLSYRAWLRLITAELAGSSSVLDVGCGVRSPLAVVPGSFRSVGVEAHRPALEASRAAGIHDDYLEQDARSLDLADDSFDAVVMLDLIEHLDREDGEELLRRAERIAREVVVLTTPNGFINQSPYDGNALQEHRSGWTVEDLSRAGFTVYGMNGLKPLRGELSYPRRPRLITRPLSILSQPFVWRRPALAFELLAVKRKQPARTAPGSGTRVPDSAGTR
jgi:SAM-dependent methyltransferase